MQVTRHKAKWAKREIKARPAKTCKSLARAKKQTKLSRDKSSLSAKPPYSHQSSRGVLEALSTTMLAMDEAKEARDVASSTPVAHEAHFVLVPQPSTHPRDPLVCDAVL